jgi:hypothetical protein
LADRDTPPPLLHVLWCSDICGSKKLGDQKKADFEICSEWLTKFKNLWRKEAWFRSEFVKYNFFKVKVTRILAIYLKADWR